MHPADGPRDEVKAQATCKPGVAALEPTSLDAKLGFLRSPAAHAAGPGAGPQVECIETHMSWVFLAGDRVLKLKKPVSHAFLDFSSLAAREACCREELRLNARLAPGVYRGLMALLWQAGRWSLVPEPQLVDRDAVVDWLVCMKRLPRERMLDTLIAGGRLQPAPIAALVAVLSAFYRLATPAAVGADELLRRMQHELAVHRQVLLQPQFALDGAAAALDRYELALRRQQPALRQRVARGRIVEGHGDLRPEHVCLLATPVVIDCIEFNPRLRQVDPFDELEFLALECELAGAAWIGPQLIRGCAAGLGDEPPPALLQLYRAGRALLRARLSLAHLLEPDPRTPARWLPQGQRYLQRAGQALDATAG